LGTFVVQDDYVLDGPAEIRHFFRDEQNTTGADIPGKTGAGHSFGARANNGERQLELETPGSSLFHVLVLMVGVRHASGQ
jgi:hypothetical protein